MNLINVFQVPQLKDIWQLISTIEEITEDNNEVPNKFYYTSKISNKYLILDAIIFFFYDVTEGNARRINTEDMLGHIETCRQIALVDRKSEEESLCQISHIDSHFIQSIIPSEKIEKDKVFATGFITDTFTTRDNDPYQTAGGYKVYKTPVNTKVDFILNEDGSIKLEYDAHCIVDHYNTQINFKRTNDGHETFKHGERIERQSIDTGKHDINDVIDNYNIELTAIDYNKSHKMIQKLIKNLSNKNIAL